VVIEYYDTYDIINMYNNIRIAIIAGYIFCIHFWLFD